MPKTVTYASTDHARVADARSDRIVQRVPRSGQSCVNGYKWIGPRLGMASPIVKATVGMRIAMRADRLLGPR